MGETHDIIVIGGGFGGIRAVRKFRDELGLDTVAFESGPDVGGTWYWNRYPGCRCDIESIHYSFSFDEQLQQDWEWSERYASQPEILAYLNHVAERFDIRRSFRFETRVIGLTWQEDDRCWRVDTDAGERFWARFVVSCAGNVSVPKVPEFDGMDTFAGAVYATHHWPQEEPNLEGKRVAVIGTGASGIQVIPKVAERCAHLTVFQRTPNFASPLRNRPADPDEVGETKANYPAIRKAARESFLGVPYPAPAPSALEASHEERTAVYEQWWKVGGFGLLMASYGDLMFVKEANDTAADFVRSKIRERTRDPEVAELLCPDDHAFGTKRLPMETEYYETYNRSNVDLVHVKDNPIVAVTTTGVRLAHGQEFELEVIILATGFDAWTGALSKMGVVGRDGERLNDTWSAGPISYLGLMTHGYPNLFTVTGPGAAVALYNNPLAIEDHVDLAAAAIAHMSEAGLETMEPTTDAQAGWHEELNARCYASLFPTADSWYMGANIPGKPRVVMMYVGAAAEYRATCAKVVNENWRGFAFEGARIPA